MSVRSVLSKVRSWIGWGASANDLATLEAAFGGPVDFVRVYGWVGKLPAGVEALAATRCVVVSLKFRDASGAVIPAVDIAAGKWNAQIDAAYAWFNALPGLHVLLFEHEEDAKAAASSGTPTQLNAAFVFCADRARKSAGWHGLIGCCVTGYDPANREPLYEPSFAASDVVTVDQPYASGALPWKPADATVGPAVDWFTQHYADKPILITEWGATAAPGTARADWIAQFAKDLAGPRYANVAGVLYWDDTTGSFDTRLNTAADVAAWAAAGKALRVVTPPPPPPSRSVLMSDVSTLASAMAALAASGAELSSTQAAFVAAQADYAAKLTAATAAAKVITG